MCHKYLSWAFEMSMGKKNKVVIFPVSLIPKVLILHLCDSSEKNHFLRPSKTIQTYTVLVLELTF